MKSPPSCWAKPRHPEGPNLNTPSGDRPPSQQNAALPPGDHSSELQNQDTGADKKFVSGCEFIYMKEILHSTKMK